MPSGPPCQEAWRSDVVFTGTVIAIGEAPARSVARAVRFRIRESLVGLNRDRKEIEVRTGMGGGDCGYPFRAREDYLVYAYKTPDGHLETGICTRTQSLDDASEDMAYFRALPGVPAAGEIRISAYDVNKARNTGLKDVRITIEGTGRSRGASTDSSGRYTFTGLPPGEYRVNASLAGYAVPHVLEPVEIRARGCAEVAVPMQLDRRITGRITTKEGHRAAGVTVQVVRTRPQHENELPFAADSATTDTNGRYELRHLGTGDYYLGINLDRTPSAQNPYTRWFYPGTEDPGAAAIVHLLEQPGTQRYDLTLPAAQKEQIIDGTVIWPDGRPAQGVNVFLEDPRWPWQVSTVAATTNADGRFAIRRLDGTHYRLHAALPSNQSVSAEPADIAPGNDPLHLRLVLTRKGYSPSEGLQKGLERWRKGLGL